MKNLILLAPIVLLWACQPKPDLAVETAAIKKAAEDYHTAAASGQYDVVKALYAENPRVMIPSMETTQGAKAPSDMLDAFASMKNLKVSFSSPEVVIDAGGDNAYTVATVDLSYDNPYGGTTSERIRDFHVWSKQTDGTWKIDADIWNDLPSMNGVYEYVAPVKGQATMRNGKFIFLFAQGKGPMDGRAGTYTLAGDTAIATFAYATDPKLVGTSFKWVFKSWSGDTVTYTTFTDKGVTTGEGRAVRVGQ